MVQDTKPSAFRSASKHKMTDGRIGSRVRRYNELCIAKLRLTRTHCHGIVTRHSVANNRSCLRHVGRSRHGERDRHAHLGHILSSFLFDFVSEEIPGRSGKIPGGPLREAMGSPRGARAIPAKAALYICPMDADVTSDRPGACPKCGMALEPATPTLDEQPDPEARAMLRRLWVSVALGVPLFAVAMLDMTPSHPATQWFENFRLADHSMGSFARLSCSGAAGR